MSATRKPSEVYDGISVQKAADFFVGNKNRWRLYIGNPPVLIEDLDWECISPFGSVRNVVVVDENGLPIFDRPEYREAPNVNVVVWGRDPDGTVKLAVITQPRPHADHPWLKPGTPCDPVVFCQIVMGFTRKLFGEDIFEQYESAKDAAKRETAEESGAKVIRNIEAPSAPWHNPNPTFVATWSNLLFIEVDLEALEAIKSTRNEPIYNAEFVDVPTLRKRVADGVGSNGEFYRMCTANSAWFIFECCHPELFKA
ncbi:MAG: hypothetical protein WCW66_04050 [Patescibacteria group bacterium]